MRSSKHIARTCTTKRQNRLGPSLCSSRFLIRLNQSDLYYNVRLVKRMGLQKLVMQIMAEHELDMLVYPHQQRLVVPVGERQVGRNGVVASVTGFPAIAVPGGFSKPTAGAPIGVPAGIEILGRLGANRR